MKDPIETNELTAFTKTVEVGSLSRAAQELGIPRATVSRRLARLEERLGMRLLRRTTRSLILTESGEIFYRQACIALAAVQAAEESVRISDDEVRGELRVSVPPMMSSSFNTMLCEFAMRYPELRTFFHIASQHVDLLQSNYDVALRASSQIQPGLIARTLFRDPMIAVASPNYLATRGVPQTERDLRDHACLLGFTHDGLAETHWPLVAGGKQHIKGVFFANEIGLLCDAAIKGLGIAVLPRNFVSVYLNDKSLVQVLPYIIGAEMQVALVYRERAFMPPQVRAFIDVVVEWVSRDHTAPAPQS